MQLFKTRSSHLMLLSSIWNFIVCSCLNLFWVSYLFWQLCEVFRLWHLNITMHVLGLSSFIKINDFYFIARFFLSRNRILWKLAEILFSVTFLWELLCYFIVWLILNYGAWIWASNATLKINYLGTTLKRWHGLRGRDSFELNTHVINRWQGILGFIKYFPLLDTIIFAALTFIAVTGYITIHCYFALELCVLLSVWFFFHNFFGAFPWPSISAERLDRMGENPRQGYMIRLRAKALSIIPLSYTRLILFVEKLSFNTLTVR